MWRLGPVKLPISMLAGGDPVDELAGGGPVGEMAVDGMPVAGGGGWPLF